MMLLKFAPEAFVENLEYMGLGMLGIFIVMGIIVGVTYLLNGIFRDKKDKQDRQ